MSAASLDTMGQPLHEKGIKFKLFGNEFYYTACSVLVVLTNLCCDFHCQKGLSRRMPRRCG